MTKLIEIPDAFDKIELSGIFATVFNSRAFQALMANASTYLFSAIVVLNGLKLMAALHEFIKSSNRSIHQYRNLGWHSLQLALIGTAVIGTLLATATFTLITPALFVTAMTLDALRNFTLLARNIYKLAILRYRLRHQLSNPQIQSEYLLTKEKLVKKIKRYSLGLLLSSIVAVSTAIIFLFPHVGLGAIASMVITLGTIKASIAGIAGITAATALFGPLVVRGAIAFKNKLLVKFRRKKVGEDGFSFEDEDNDKKNLIELDTKNSITQILAKTGFHVSNNKHADKALQDASDDIKAVCSRAIIMAAIDDGDKPFAESVYIKMLDLKYKQLEGNLLGVISFQQDKIRQKMVAISKLKAFIQHGCILDKHHKPIDNSKQMIDYLERVFPKTHHSFWSKTSDTQSIINLFKDHIAKFYPAADAEFFDDRTILGFSP